MAGDIDHVALARRVSFMLLASLTCDTPTSRRAPVGTPEPAIDAYLGEDIYLEDCARCHGVDGTGNGPDGSVLRPPPRNFVEARFEYKSTPGG